MYCFWNSRSYLRNPFMSFAFIYILFGAIGSKSYFSIIEKLVDVNCQILRYLSSGRRSSWYWAIIYVAVFININADRIMIIDPINHQFMLYRAMWIYNRLSFHFYFSSRASSDWHNEMLSSSWKIWKSIDEEILIWLIWKINQLPSNTVDFFTDSKAIFSFDIAFRNNCISDC